MGEGCTKDLNNQDLDKKGGVLCVRERGTAAHNAHTQPAHIYHGEPPIEAVLISGAVTSC